MHYYQINKHVTAFTTTREGGYSLGAYGGMNVNGYCGDNVENVKANREALCKMLKIGTDRLIMPHQTHGTKSVIVDELFMQLSDEQRTEQLEGVDALITSLRGTAIGVSTADCVPVLIYDPVNEVAAAIHAGWRGTVAHIVSETFAHMLRKYGTRGEDCQAIIGPSICMECFEVGDEVYDAFKHAGFNMSSIARRYSDKWHIDLWECNRLQLLDTRIDAHNIEVTGICTYAAYEKYFSARRLGIQSGRLFTGIVLR